MGTNLTASETDDPVTVPDEGEEVDAVTLGAGKGPIRRGLQALLNQIRRIHRGRTTIRGMHIVAPGGADVPTPADGLLSVLGRISVVLFGPGTSSIQALSGDIEATAGNLLGLLLRLSGSYVGSSTQPTPAVPEGDFAFDDPPIMRATVSAVGNLQRGRNVLSVTKIGGAGTGVYEVVSNNCPVWVFGDGDGAPLELCAVASPNAGATIPRLAVTNVTKVGAGAGKVKVTVYTYNGFTGLPIDCGFSLRLDQ